MKIKITYKIMYPEIVNGNTEIETEKFSIMDVVEAISKIAEEHKCPSEYVYIQRYDYVRPTPG